MELKILNELRPTKADIKIAADYFIQAVEDGLENPLELAVKVKVWEELMKDVKEKLMKYSLDEIDKHSGKAVIHETKVERIEGGIKYDYSSDNTWQLLKASSDYAVDKLKNREDFLKKIPSGLTFVDEATGEAIVGPTKTSVTTLKITLAK
jgi:hypothetical protein